MKNISYLKIGQKSLGIATAMLLLTANSCGILKSKKAKPKPGTALAVPVRPKADSALNSLKPYSQVITAKAVTQKGLFMVHKVADKYFFEIPNSLLSKEILLVTRLSKSTPGAGNYGGEEIGAHVIYWEKGPNNKLFLKVSAQISVADSASMISKAVTNSNLDPINASFPIKARSKDSTASVIDVTDFLISENPLLAFDANDKKSYGLTAQMADRSYIESVKSFPINTEIKTIRTYSAIASGMGKPLPATAEAGAVTLEMNNSFVMLPEKPMRKRLYDERVGFFASSFNKYTDDQQKVKSEDFIHRWRLEPKDEDIDKFRRGELVEPKKQIVYYIDPATPKKWRPYLIAGINDWQKAFEQAGFKNAIIGKEWPEGDSTMSLDDARFSVLRYFASPQQNAYGPNLADPRTGEILESHIGWYHNVMSLVHRWYMIQCGAVDPRARKNKFDDQLMGQLIRFVSSHEIGHTLGLRHNMGSSSTVPVEKLRDKAWVEAHGHTPSIMDYARFNYVAQPEDHISEKGLFPRINDYDKWAIQWGYKPVLDQPDAEAEAKILNKITIDSLAHNKRLWFSGEGRDHDPRSQSEDLGDDAIKASNYGIKNLKRIVPQLINWTREEGEDYTELKEMYKEAVGQYTKYAYHVMKSLGGVEVTFKTYDQPGAVYKPTSLVKQKQAIQFFNQEIFTTPKWLVDRNILDKIEPGEGFNDFETLQAGVIASVTSQSRLYRVMMNERDYGKGAYSPREWLNDLKNGIFSELKNGNTIDSYRRTLQKMYVGSIITMYNKHFAYQGSLDNILAGITPTEIILYSNVKPLAYAHLKVLRNDVHGAIPKTKDYDSKIHLEYLQKMLDKILTESPIPGLTY
ncbi:zinc-dependent metalloprotease [Mucilaginibacter lappiensis]|uniref:Ribosomal protein S18 acetylase RimI-like enzyme n=1 Tax=Mucilaginibacter lappiensis TaxID=354630 RepID=A0A841JIQ1_9SPHI|nr:zinc-dependent metalloprotease [Mucilaginibacter lappiensis]MBB6130820.1 ribosomal protein S18 acetylase RimI-like enzyme [Mucilaginibacter lappiensis]